MWGSKAWNLMRLANAGLAVPPAFVLPTAWSRCAISAQSADLRRTLADGIARLEDCIRPRLWSGSATFACVGALRELRVDARHAGDGP